MPVSRLIIPVILLTILLSLFELSLAAMFNREEARRDAEIYIAKNEVLLDIVALHVEDSFTSITSDLLIIRDRSICSFPGSWETLSERSRRSCHLSTSRRVFDLLLMHRGNERVRVDSWMAVRMVPPGELQDKSGRSISPIVSPLVRARSVSPLDLNIGTRDRRFPTSR